MVLLLIEGKDTEKLIKDLVANAIFVNADVSITTVADIHKLNISLKEFLYAGKGK